MENSVNTRKFSIVDFFKTLFSNNELDDDVLFSEELKQIKEKESSTNISNLEKQVRYDVKRKERKSKNDFKIENKTLNNRVLKQKIVEKDLERE